MERQDKIFLGIDLDNEEIQVAVYDLEKKDAVNICLEEDDSKPVMPVCLLKKKTANEWVFGSTAKEYKKIDGGFYVENLLELLKKEEALTIDGVQYTGAMLLRIFLKKIMAVIRLKYFNYSIGKLIVTVSDRYLCNQYQILEILNGLGLKKEQMGIFSRGQSFMYYVMNQSREIYSMETVMYALEEESACYYRMIVNRQVTPHVAVLEKKEMLPEYTLKHLSELTPEQAAVKTEQMLNQLLYNRLTSALFFTGKGAAAEWTNSVLQHLCKDRRVFTGQNLFVKGACLGARSIITENLKEFTLISDEMTVSTISVRLYANGKETEYVLGNANTPWWEVHGTVRVILDDTSEIPVIVKNCLKKNPVTAILKPDGFKVRENKTICLLLQLYYTDRDTPVFTIRDIGFGEFYHTTYRIWEQRLSQ